MKLYKFSDDQDVMWIKDEQGRAQQIASVAFALDGVNVMEIADVPKWARVYAEQFAAERNAIFKNFAKEIAGVSEEINNWSPEGSRYAEQLQLDVSRAKAQLAGQGIVEISDKDIDEMAAHIAMLIEYRKHECK